MSAGRAVELDLWNVAVPRAQLQSEVDRLLALLRTKNQQAVRQLKFIINKGVEADLYTAQGFEKLSAGLTGAVNGWWQVPDADQQAGIDGFAAKNELWQTRRGAAIDFWAR